jgi:serine/threonine protein kinase
VPLDRPLEARQGRHLAPGHAGAALPLDLDPLSHRITLRCARGARRGTTNDVIHRDLKPASVLVEQALDAGGSASRSTSASRGKVLHTARR